MKSLNPTNPIAALNTWECSVCLDTFKEIAPRLIATDPVCNDCVQDQILPLFEKALNEIDYPPLWGDSVLYATDFADELGRDFLERYARCEEEFQTLPKCRVYCQHKILAEDAPLAKGMPASSRPGQGTRPRLWPSEQEQARKEGKKIVTCGAMATVRNTDHSQCLLLMPMCWSCTGRVWPCDGKPIWYSGERPCAQHDCKVEEDASANFITDDMKRGRDYQICGNENCGRVMQLKDGCNHIICLCGHAQCFLCGMGPFDDGDDHWSFGKPCPRYNQPGAANAQYD